MDRGQSNFRPHQSRRNHNNNNSQDDDNKSNIQSIQHQQFNQHQRYFIIISDIYIYI